MVNDLIHGIANALYAAFDGIPIYTEQVEQGLDQPCFFILPLLEEEKPLLNTRALRHISVDIHYFNNENYAELQNTAAKLYPVLRLVQLLDGSYMRGANLHHEIQDGVLHFFAEFSFTVIYPGEEKDKFNDLEHNLGVKHG